jgi:hypothetical protein
MPEILSTNKPFNPNPKPEVKIEYNDKSYESYIKAGFPDNIPHSITGPRIRLQTFLSAVDLRKGPIERTVRTMVRLRAPDYTTKKHERKEWIYYTEDWEGKNWLGVPIAKPISEHIEGKYTEVVTRPKFDERTGEHIDNAWRGTREVYYIPWSKKAVDEIIANSAHTDKTGIKFIVKFATEDSTDSIAGGSRNQFSYDMFLWDWNKLYEWQYWPWEDIVQRPSPKKSGTNLEFKPS